MDGLPGQMSEPTLEFGRREMPILKNALSDNLHQLEQQTDLRMGVPWPLPDGVHQ